MKRILYAAALLFLLSATLPGCARWYSASTVATYEAYGAKLTYDSSKNQENFKAKVGFNPDGTIKELDIQTTATTAESAIAAAAASMEKFADALLKMIPIMEKAAMAGGS